MKILNGIQIKEVDQLTVLHEPIKSIDLMERAGEQIFNRIKEKFYKSDKFAVFCGPGNNGGDGLVIARLLNDAGLEVEVFVLKGNYTPEFSLNLNRLEKQKIKNLTIKSELDLTKIHISNEAVVIDALYGAGISRPLDGIAAQLVTSINKLSNYKIAIDLPSGLSPDSYFVSTFENTVKADYTLSIQLPKFAFMFAENSAFVGTFECIDIHLSETCIKKLETPFIYLDEENINAIVKPRAHFGHKGTFGHALLVAGSEGKAGAAILASKAALRSGCGLLTALVSENAILPMHSALPEAMVINRLRLVDPFDYNIYDAVGFGPGAGTSIETSERLYDLLNTYHSPLVIDADGVNCLAYNPTWYRLLKTNIILTPHPGEFDRLTHQHKTGLERFQSQVKFSEKYGVTIVLKGHHTSVTTPEGLTFFNSTGNNGMATAGSGDVLTGIITSLCAQGYQPWQSAVLGVYLHGFAGDSFAAKNSQTSLIASDLIEEISSFFHRFEK